MCNAWNHPPNCTCGWGGEGHLGIRTGGSAHSALAGFARLGASLGSFTNPNAHCPVCGADVFFYASPDGGRVFFDELGPPWPKHPCTDNGSTPIRSVPRPPMMRARTGRRAYSWQEEGWEPFLPDDVRSYTPELFYVGGNWNGRRQVVYMLRTSSTLTRDEIDFWPAGLWQLRIHGDAFQASIWCPGLSPDVRRVFSTALDARAYLRKHEAGRRR